MQQNSLATIVSIAAAVLLLILFITISVSAAKKDREYHEASKVQVVGTVIGYETKQWTKIGESHKRTYTS